MWKTAYNPTYVCTDCDRAFSTRPLRLVLNDRLTLPPCPNCGGTLTVGSILASLTYEYSEHGIEYVEALADDIRQDYHRELEGEVSRALSQLQVREEG